MCFIHTSATECTTLVPKTACNHFRIMDICGTTAVTVAPVTVAPVVTTVAAVTTTVAAVTTVPAGYITRNTGMQILAGTIIGVGLNEQQCLDMCLMLPTCLSVDYNSAEMSCWSHETSTYCSAMVANAVVNNYQRVTCSATSTNAFSQTLYQFHRLGATQIASGITQAQCLEMCLADATCSAVDYDTRTLSCWRHLAATACSTPVAKAFCSHYTKTACTITTTPSPVVAPTLAPTTGVTLNFPTPTVLPSGWAVYPGFNIVNGGFNSVQTSGDACLNACAALATCTAFDYNANNGGCWFHPNTSPVTNKCDTLSSAPAVYHAKKVPICTVDTAGNGYVIPTLINP